MDSELVGCAPAAEALQSLPHLCNKTPRCSLNPSGTAACPRARLPPRPRTHEYGSLDDSLSAGEETSSIRAPLRATSVTRRASWLWGFIIPPNDPSSATWLAGSVDSNRSAMAGLAAAHWPLT